MSADTPMRHHRIELSTPWAHEAATEVSAFAPDRTGPDASPGLGGRATLSVDHGPFTVSLRPTAADLRALAALCHALAADLDGLRFPEITA